MKYIWTILGTLVILSLTLYIGYTKGYAKGVDEVKLEYLQQKAEYIEAYNIKEQEYEDKLAKLERQVIKDKETYDNELASLSGSYSDRLSESEQRAAYYQKLYEQKGTGCDLPTHTARLDRALTEGIQLVRELRRLVELRDSQLRALGEYLDTENVLHD